ncbi:hypothetical protein [Mariniblastus fucicola]|uniref:Uncharacterized protein n=1 Tax=Mariniblastus fucicola TaxID=980251 RepID=A0A5B9P6G8_9BACT|nr:hypothetical protein [Mariniblastus fucicola]QEG20520.1 hypothetical protein MFFC18_03690 [Mariniblastus fucicola]
MNENSNKVQSDFRSVNPYASPAPELNPQGRSQPVPTAADEARQERARWIAICMLNGSVVFVIGLFLVNSSNVSNHDGAMFSLIGACMIFMSIGVFVGPMLWSALRNERDPE